MKEHNEAQLISLESAVLMFREDGWPCLVRGLNEPELGSGIARYLNRFSVGAAAAPPASPPTLPTLIKP